MYAHMTMWLRIKGSAKWHILLLYYMAFIHLSSEHDVVIILQAGVIIFL